MKSLPFIVLCLSGFLFSCGQSHQKHKPNPAAVRLNDQAIGLEAFNNMDSLRKALALLDSATSLDSNYFLGYYNKLSVLNQLKDYDRAIQTANHLIRLRPMANDLYSACAILYEKTGDTTAAKTYFTKSLSICNAVLDTMSRKNPSYDMLLLNKSVSMIMLGDSATGNQLLTQLNERHQADGWKELIAPFMGKSRKEIIEELFK